MQLHAWYILLSNEEVITVCDLSHEIWADYTNVIS